MSCNENCNDCIQEDCLPYSNPCYENCGCLNPTTAECVTKLGVHTNLGIDDTMTLKDAMAALNTKAINPYNKVTQTTRLAMTSVSIGTHVYQTDGGEGAEGVWVYKSTGWVFAY